VSRVGIFGGSFNPPHIGHQALCLMLLETGPIDEVWVVPTYRHYFGKALASFEDRVAMCECMVDPLGRRARVCSVERDVENSQGRMLDTLTALSTLHPQHEFRLIIGADILLETNRWHAWSEVAALAPPLVFQRGGYDGGTFPAPPTVSSSAIRECLASGESAVPMVSKSVQACIESRGLYQP